MLARSEVDRLLQCTPNLKHRAFLSTLYACGMRFTEAAHLKIHDIDSSRMQVHITHGKGAKERLVPLSPRLLTTLRDYWKEYRPTDLLFPGKSASQTCADRTIQRAIKEAGQKAGIRKRVFPHILRQSYETGMLEAGDEFWSDLQCCHCGSDRMVLLETIEQASWKETFSYSSERLPEWYVQTREADDRVFWDAATGEGFNDWFLENVIESAKGSDGLDRLDAMQGSGAPPASQPYLPGLRPTPSELFLHSLH